MSIAQAAQLVRAQGRGNDTQLMHVTPSEVKALQGIAQAHGGSLTVNPQTGLPEAGFLESVLPVVAGTAIGFATGMPWLGAAVGGLGGYASTGSIEQGLLAGIGAFGGASALGNLAGAGATAAAGGAAAAGTPAAAMATDIGAMAAMDTAMAGGTAAAQGAASQAVASGAASQLQNQMVLNALPASGKFSALGSGFNQLLANPSTAISTLGGTNLAMMGAPLLGASMGSSDDGIQNPPAQDSYIRPSAYDPATQTYTALPPVQSSDWGTRSFDDYRAQYGFQEGGEVQPRYQPPVRTVDPAVNEYNRMLMDQARQEYINQQPMTNVAQLTPSLMAAPTVATTPTAPAVSTPTVAPSGIASAKLYDPATQTYKANPSYVDPNTSKNNWDTTLRDTLMEMSGLGFLTYKPPAEDQPLTLSDYRKMQRYGYLAEGGKVGLAAIPKFQAGGDMESDAFVIPADVVSALGNGSTEAGLAVLNEYLGLAMPIEGEGDGLSDDIPATIEGEQPARVANGEAYIPPETVAKIGEGDPERGSAKLYAMLDKIREAAHGKTKQQREVEPDKVMPT